MEAVWVKRGQSKCSALPSCFMQSVSKPRVRQTKREHLHNVGAWCYPAELDLSNLFFFFFQPLVLPHSAFDSQSVSLPPPQSQGLDCSAEAWQRPRMGKVQGRQLTLPASLNQRVNLHRGHNGFSLVKPPHMQAACHQPCSCSLTPFCVSLSSLGLPCPNRDTPQMYTMEVSMLWRNRPIFLYPSLACCQNTKSRSMFQPLFSALSYVRSWTSTGRVANLGTGVLPLFTESGRLENIREETHLGKVNRER